MNMDPKYCLITQNLNDLIFKPEPPLSKRGDTATDPPKVGGSAKLIGTTKDSKEIGDNMP